MLPRTTLQRRTAITKYTAPPQPPALTLRPLCRGLRSLHRWCEKCRPSSRATEWPGIGAALLAHTVSLAARHVLCEARTLRLRAVFGRHTLTCTISPLCALLPSLRLASTIQDLQQLQQKYGHRGLEILAFPCNQVCSGARLQVAGVAPVCALPSATVEQLRTI